MEAKESPGRYQPPTIEDYGTLEALTADASLLSPLGLGGTMAAVTGPLVPPGGGPGPGDQHVTTSTPTQTAGPSDTTFEGGDTGDTGDTGEVGDTSTPGGGGGGPGGGGNGSGGSPGGGGSGDLPFTGFPAAFAAAVGGAMAATGAAVRRGLRRR